jgi:hypothetical protein
MEAAMREREGEGGTADITVEELCIDAEVL